MNKARIKEEAEHFFDGPSKRRDHVTLTSCLIFAEVIAGMAADAEREECAKVCDQFDAQNPYIGQGRKCAKIIRERGVK